jgi:hypothetical protein
MVDNSMNINKMNNHLSTQLIEHKKKKTTTRADGQVVLEIQVLTWDRHKNVRRLNWLIGSQPFPLDNWISNDNTYINKR